MSAWLWVESLQACVSKIWSPIMRARSREAGSDYNVQLYARGAVSKLEVLRSSPSCWCKNDQIFSRAGAADDCRANEASTRCKHYAGH